MHNYEQLKELSKILSKCNDTSSDALKIVSGDIKTELLDRLEIRYVPQAEGISIDLSDQKSKIYKTKSDAIKYFKSNEEKSILVLEDSLVYIKDNELNPFFENLIFSRKIQDLMLESDVISYHDNVNKKFIFLSEHIGKVEVGYKNKVIDFFNSDYALSSIYQKISTKFSENEYKSFFRDNFIKVANDIDVLEDRFYRTLIHISNILDNSNREFELYKNKFSFEKFHSELKKEKEKYIKNIQENLSEFLSKVNALPVQFGVYILLVFRFKDEVVPLIGTIVLIITWSSFSVFSLLTMQKSVKFIKRKFEQVMNEISLESGIDAVALKKDKDEVFEKISDIQQMINWYIGVVGIFRGPFMILCQPRVVPEILSQI